MDEERGADGMPDGSARAAGDPDGQRPEIDWGAVRCAYEGREASVRTILARFGLRSWELRRAREAGGWRTRMRPCEPLPAAPGAGGSLETRLASNLRAQLARLESRTGGETQIDEREARTLAELTRAWSIMTDTRNGKTRTQSVKAAGTSKKTNDAGPRAVSDDLLDRRRAALARRLEQLREREDKSAG